MNELSVHCMVRNEPFVWYAVRSVYDYADRILLYDTGSYDDHTMQDNRTLIKQDDRKIITFQNVPIEVDETRWSDKRGPSHYIRMAAENKNKRGKWFCRQKMIDDTETEYFMILDGDEVHYRITMERIRWYLDHWPSGKICGFLPLTWFSDMEHCFHRSRSGRVFVTQAVKMTHYSPGELHLEKITGRKIGSNLSISFTMTQVEPYAHFEAYLKPWRRNVPKERNKPFDGDLPEVIKNNPYYAERFRNEGSHK